MRPQRAPIYAETVVGDTAARRSAAHVSLG